MLNTANKKKYYDTNLFFSKVFLLSGAWMKYKLSFILWKFSFHRQTIDDDSNQVCMLFLLYSYVRIYSNICHRPVPVPETASADASYMVNKPFCICIKKIQIQIQIIIKFSIEIITTALYIHSFATNEWFTVKFKEFLF